MIKNALGRVFTTRRMLIAGAAVAVPAAGFVGVSGMAYSKGWRAGYLDKLSGRHSFRRLFFSTGEGSLLLGNESSMVTWRGSDGAEQSNPWFFSTTNDQVEEFRRLLGTNVAIRYTQIMKHWHSFGGDTDYRIEEIVPINPASAAPCSVDAGSGLRSNGDRTGRIVKVTRRGTMFKTYEMTLQEGRSGNRFIDMSILDDGMYQCAINFLRSGQMALVSYRETLVRNAAARDTNYDIVAIRPLAGG